MQVFWKNILGRGNIKYKGYEVGINGIVEQCFRESVLGGEVIILGQGKDYIVLQVIVRILVYILGELYGNFLKDFEQRNGMI